MSGRQEMHTRLVLWGNKCTGQAGPISSCPPFFCGQEFYSEYPKPISSREAQTDRQREGGPVGGRNLWRTVNSWRIFPLCSETAAAGGLHMHLVQLAEPEMHLVRAGESRQDEVLAFLHREGSLRTVSDSRRAHL